MTPSALNLTVPSRPCVSLGTACKARNQTSLDTRVFYYHFLDMKTGRRTLDCELSTIDSTFVIAGALTAAEYFNRDIEDEREIRNLAEVLYRRADWQWAQNGEDTVTHGWTPERG